MGATAIGNSRVDSLFSVSMEIKQSLSCLPVYSNLDLLLNPQPGTNVIFMVSQNYSLLATVNAVYNSSIWI